MLVVPNVMGVMIWSPLLDERGTYSLCKYWGKDYNKVSARRERTITLIAVVCLVTSASLNLIV